jgi:ElaB/YqjD/DUF883 family membrane-anchored ribosome-binding protein
MRTTSPTSQQTLSQRISHTVGGATEEAAERVKNAATHAAELTSGGLKYAGEAADHASEVGGTFRTALEKSLRDQPRATLAGAAVIGFVFGALWKLVR